MAGEDPEAKYTSWLGFFPINAESAAIPIVALTGTPGPPVKACT
jgi:hypothetical protein